MSSITVNDVDLYYELTGPEGAPVVAFSNSIGTTLEMWDAQVEALSAHYRCLRYDTRGHGRSSVADRPARIADLADDLAGLLDALSIPKAHIVGLSLGGMTAQAVALRYPDRITSLTLMATAAYLPPPEGWEQRAEIVCRDGMAAIGDAVISRWFTPPFTEASPDKVAQVRDRFLEMDPRGYAVCCRVIRDMDLRRDIGSITTPTLIIAGADDPATPVAMMEDIRARIADSELVVLPRAAHLLAIEQADRVNRHLLGFLGRAVQLPNGGDAGLAATSPYRHAKT